VLTADSNYQPLQLAVKLALRLPVGKLAQVHELRRSA
jgi:hypothetical protein